MEEDKPNLVLSNRRVGVRLRQPILILTKSDTHMSDAKKKFTIQQTQQVATNPKFCPKFYQLLLGTREDEKQ